MCKGPGRREASRPFFVYAPCGFTVTRLRDCTGGDSTGGSAGRGMLREKLWGLGRWWDELLYAVLEYEWEPEAKATLTT